MRECVHTVKDIHRFRKGKPLTAPEFYPHLFAAARWAATRGRFIGTKQRRGLFLFLFLLPDADLLFMPLNITLYVRGRRASAQTPFGGRGNPDAAYVALNVFAPDTLLHDRALLKLGLGHKQPPLVKRPRLICRGGVFPAAILIGGKSEVKTIPFSSIRLFPRGSR
jgi:hypothetical protein